MPRRLTLFIQLIAIFFIAGCAFNQRASSLTPKNQKIWHGRMSIQIEAIPLDLLSRKQSFSAAFALLGTPEAGELTFFTPLGSTAAAICWTPQTATLESSGVTRSYAGLSPLVLDLLGTNIPVPTLFSWLEGLNEPEQGWEVDLSLFNQGKISAQRRMPLPQTHLRLVLEP